MSKKGVFPEMEVTVRTPNRKVAITRAFVAAVVLAVGHPAAVAQQSESPSAYPTKVVRIVVPFGPGGALDLVSRLVAERLGQKWGQSVIVENKPGANGAIGIDFVSKSSPDGYTLISVPATNLVINPHLYAKLPYDPFKDLEPVTTLVSVPNVLVVSAGVPAKSLKELIALAKAKPDELTYSSPGPGSQAHLASEYLNGVAEVKVRHIPYNGIGQALQGVVAGEITMMFAQIQAATPFIQSGKVRPMAIATLKRSPLMPETPTLVELGLPDFEAVTWNALMAPRGTPPAIVAKIQADVSSVLLSPDVQSRLAAIGTEPVGDTPQQLTKQMNSEYKRYGELIRKFNIKIEQ
jgi:tripartite-type tricarboxylate transporter receptor subunit TctC